MQKLVINNVLTAVWPLNEFYEKILGYIFLRKDAAVTWSSRMHGKQKFTVEIFKNKLLESIVDTNWFKKIIVDYDLKMYSSEVATALKIHWLRGWKVSEETHFGLKHLSEYFKLWSLRKDST